MWPFKRQDRALWQVGDAWPGPTTAAGVRVTPDSAMRLSAVWSCTRLLADVVSELPVHVFRNGTREEVDPPRVLVTPAAGTDLPDWLWQHMVSYLLRGNVTGLVVDRAGLGRPSQIELVNPDRLVPKVDQYDRTVTWRLDGQEVDQDEVWHRRAYPVPGQVLGLSPIGYAAQSIGLGLAAEKFGATFFGDGSVPSGVLTTEHRIDRQQAEDFSYMWESSHKGRRKTAVMGSGLHWQAVSVAPEESQFLDTLKFNVQQVARIFGVPPEMIASEAGGSLTYANVEQRDLSLVKYAVAPWLGRLERAMTTLVPRGQYVKFNANAFLRADTLTRYQAHAIALDKGFLTIEEVRHLEDREPLPAGAPRIEAVA